MNTPAIVPTRPSRARKGSVRRRAHAEAAIEECEQSAAAPAGAAVVAELLAGPCRDAVLNVAAANEPAIRVYRRLGFRTHCRHYEGTATHRAAGRDADR